MVIICECNPLPWPITSAKVQDVHTIFSYGIASNRPYNTSLSRYYLSLIQLMLEIAALGT